MCGLAGSFTQTGKHPLNDKQRLRRARVLEGLLYANAARGTDATGIATIPLPIFLWRCAKRFLPIYREG